MIDVTRPNRDWAFAHPGLHPRWLALGKWLAVERLFCLEEEIYRPDARQGYLWAQGRLPADCEAKGLNPGWARPGPIVTNAWSSKLSAHGFLLAGNPAAAAIDVVPTGPDLRPWTADDPWDEFVSAVAHYGAKVGLIQFHAPGKQVWDKPHLQMAEWSDRTHTLEF